MRERKRRDSSQGQTWSTETLQGLDFTVSPDREEDGFTRTCELPRRRSNPMLPPGPIANVRMVMDRNSCPVQSSYAIFRRILIASFRRTGRQPERAQPVHFRGQSLGLEGGGPPGSTPHSVTPPTGAFRRAGRSKSGSARDAPRLDAGCSATRHSRGGFAAKPGPIRFQSWESRPSARNCPSGSSRQSRATPGGNAGLAAGGKGAAGVS